VLTERYYSWRDAENIAKDDPEINLSGEGPTYNPRNFVDEEIPEQQFEAPTEPEVKAEVAQETKPDIVQSGIPETKPEARPNI